jgi:O-antigen ligase
LSALYWGYRAADVYASRNIVQKIPIYSTIIPIIFTPLQLVFFVYGNSDRAASTFSHPNIFAFYLMVTISYAYFYIINRNVNGVISRRFLAIVVIFGLICLILTQTRSALIGTAIFMFGTTACVRPKLLPAILLAASLSFLVPQVQDRFLEVLSSGVDSGLDINTAAALAEGKLDGGFVLDSYAWRKLMWGSAWDWIILSPVWGYGLESFSILSPQFFPLSTGSGAAHNVYIQLLFETGFVGLILYCFIFFLIILRVWRLAATHRPQAILLFFLVLSYCVSAYSDNMLYYLSVNLYFWFLVGALLVADPALKSKGCLRIEGDTKLMSSV